MRWLCALLFLPQMAMGAACCGGGNLFPSLIAGDASGQVTATTSYSHTFADAPVTGAAVTRAADDFETRSTLKVDAAVLLSDLWQVGVSVPIVRRLRDRHGSQADALGLGDISALAGYEFLPQWSYSAWRPKGTLFAGVVAPTGRSPQDAQSLFQIDSMGRGYWMVTAGALFQKTWGRWDALFLAEAHQPFARDVVAQAGVFHLNPAFGASGALGVGWSAGDLRLGAMLSAVFEGPVRTTGLIDEVGNPQVSYPLSAQLAYMLNDDLSLAGTFSDNSLLGATNTPLSRSLGVMLQARWDR